MNPRGGVGTTEQSIGLWIANDSMGLWIPPKGASTETLREVGQNTAHAGYVALLYVSDRSATLCHGVKEVDHVNPHRRSNMTL